MGRDADTKAPVAKPVTFNHDYAFIQQQVNDLRKKEHVQLVIALSHGGIEVDGTGDDADLAANVKGIDIIASGHYHTATAKALKKGDTIIFSPGEYGEFLSRLDVTYNVILGKVVSYKFDLIPVNDTIQGDAAVQGMVDAYDASISSSIAPLDVTLKVPVSRIGFALELASLAGAASAISLQTRSGRSPATCTSLNRDPCDFSVIASGVIRDNIYRQDGYVTFADIYNALPLGFHRTPPSIPSGIPSCPST